MTFPAKSENWNGKAVTWTHLNTKYKAEKIEYWIGPISRVLGQKKRAAKLLKTLQFYAKDGWQVVLIGHSNGANVILNALKQFENKESIKEIHMIAPAAPNNFAKNGLNDISAPITIYIGGKDKLLWLSSGAGRILGYGAMGRSGAKNNDKPVSIIKKEDFGHSTWFEDEHFDETMEMIVK
tara:strand:- start:392 stop:934 length:543 start_codon:yes stop_codon:yes gene_type:complete